jgi:hypothetical protein
LAAEQCSGDEAGLYSPLTPLPRTRHPERSAVILSEAKDLVSAPSMGATLEVQVLP